MALDVAISMNPVEAINIDTDTTFLLMLEAQARGHRLFVYTPERIALEDGRVPPRVRSLTLRPGQGDHHQLGAYQRRDMAGMDVVLIRQDPPFDLAYISATH